MITKKAYAKINLALEVMDTENGYHKVNNLMIPLDLHDEITLKKSEFVEVENDPFPGENIMTKAANLFFSETKINGGVYMTIKKNIPHAAGLAGGSTDAAAVLTGLNELYSAGLSSEKLVEMSAKLGSDVGFFIDGEVALCTGRGEIVNPLGFKAPSIRVLLIKPNTGLSTALVYKNYVYREVNRQKQIESIISSLKTNNLEELSKSIFNDLGSVALQLNSEMNSVFTKLQECGLHPYVSGSGPTMFLLNPSDKDVKLVHSILDSTVFLCDTRTN